LGQAQIIGLLPALVGGLEQGNPLLAGPERGPPSLSGFRLA